ncbi:MAG: C1 family peptidase [Anaerovoracaceae bacterium]
MQKQIKRRAAAILCAVFAVAAVLAVPVLPAGGSAAAADSSALQELTAPLAENNRQALERLQRSGDPQDYYQTLNVSYPRGLSTRSKKANTNSYPEKYDLRDKGVVTPVKFQNPWGLCWAFSCIAASESSILTDLGTTYQNAPLDLSELHLAWMAGTPRRSKSGKIIDGRVPYGDEGSKEQTNNILNTAGNAFQATTILASGIGPIAEREAPYRNKEGKTVDDSNGNPVYYSEEGDWSVPEEKRYYQSFRLRETSILPASAEGKEDGVNAIKRQLQAGRGVSVLFNWDDSCYNDAQSAYYCDGEFQSGHLVTIIGWDDTFSKENFTAGKQPAHDGAWLVKNSWGAAGNEFPNKFNWGIGSESGRGSGCFWMSYEDKTICNEQTFDYDVEQSDQDVYYLSQSDYLNNFSPSEETYGSRTSMANVYSTANRDLQLDSVSCITAAPSVNVRWQVYRLRDGWKKPTDGTRIADITKTCEYAGYHRVDLQGKQSSLLLDRKTDYSIVVTQQNAAKKYELIYEAAVNKTGTDRLIKEGSPQQYYFVGTVNRGESYVNYGDRWIDFADVVTVLQKQEEQASGEIDITCDNFPIRAYLNPAHVSRLLDLKVTPAGRTGDRLTWRSVHGATGYDVYFSRCGKKRNLKKIKTVKGTSLTRAGLKRGRTYKYRVIAWKKYNGKKVVLSRSLACHTIAGGYSHHYTVAASLKAGQNKLTLRAGRSGRVSAKTVKYRSHRKLLTKKHTARCRYVSTNSAVAAVNSKGRVTAKKAGTCKIRIYAQNGVHTSVKVVVKK